MKRILFTSLFIMVISIPRVFSQPSNDTIVYLLTCGPGKDTYSIYGHSALLVEISSKKPDLVYNWGVFDFSTKNFAWKFAKGRLDYMLNAETLKGFLEGYFFEQRYVLSQRINLNSRETRILADLINENLKPENKKYRYDFFYDDCSTRIRDLLEKSIGDKLKYPPTELGKIQSFREMVNKYQEPYPWLKFGVNLIMGSTSDKEAEFRDKMFLPIDLKDGLSQMHINREGKMIPLLQNPEVLVDFESPSVKPNFFISPPFVFMMVLIIILIMAALTKSLKIIRVMDIIVYSVFSILAVLMIFFNFFTDHEQMRMNLNIIWLNPFIFVCLLMLILNKPGMIWFRIVFFISAIFLVIQIILPQQFDKSFLLLAGMLLIRSSVRAGFEWNPLSISNTEKDLTAKNAKQAQRPQRRRMN